MRLAEMVVHWMAEHPNATRAQWAEFTVRMLHGAYRDGFARGYGWAERELDRMPADAPERLAELEAHDFVWHSPAHMTSQQLAEVAPRNQEEYLERMPKDEDRARYLYALGRYTGAFRVVVVPPPPGPSGAPKARLRAGYGAPRPGARERAM